jgi:hypothetical protein
VSHVLVMAAFEFGHPMTLVVLVESDDAAVHGDFPQRVARLDRERTRFQRAGSDAATAARASRSRTACASVRAS